MIPPRYPDTQRVLRIRKLLALEVSRIVEDLDTRRDFLLDMWSVHRKREPFLETVFTRWETLGFPLLAELEPDEVVIIDTFYRELDEFRLYIRFTQDMPTTLGERYDWIADRIAKYGQLALDALGGAPERPLIEFDDDAEEEEAADLLTFPTERARGSASGSSGGIADIEGSNDPVDGDPSEEASDPKEASDPMAAAEPNEGSDPVEASDPLEAAEPEETIDPVEASDPMEAAEPEETIDPTPTVDAET